MLLSTAYHFLMPWDLATLVYNWLGQNLDPTQLQADTGHPREGSRGLSLSSAHGTFHMNFYVERSQLLPFGAVDTEYMGAFFWKLQQR